MKKTLLGAAQDRGILIQVKDIHALAQGQGSLATVFHSIAPETISDVVYDKMADKLRQSLRDNNVDASVTVVEPAKVGMQAIGSSTTNLLIGAGVGFGLAGLLWLVLRK